MQRDGGLTGAGPPLHHQHSPELGADDAVLFPLDRGDDIGHPPGALSGECGEEGTFPLQLGVRALEQFGIEDLVFDSDDVPPLREQVTARTGAERCCGGGLVERARLGHPPVKQQWLKVLVAQADAADVTEHRAIRAVIRTSGRLGFELKPSEGQPLVDLPELQDAVFVDARERIALGPTLVVTANIEKTHRVELLFGFPLQRVKARVQRCYVLLFALKFTVYHWQIPLERRPEMRLSSLRVPAWATYRGDSAR